MKMSKWSMFLLLTYVLLLLRGAASDPLPINTPLTRTQMEGLFQDYAPYLYLHPDEEYLPSSVDWFFSNGALLYKEGEESKPLQMGRTSLREVIRTAHTGLTSRPTREAEIGLATGI
ncbi:hypothetical protein SASPL_127816 [Salvia splendens]|uniref:Dirigent protein n=1 Tax=Salvia splendens TaxID=180675 RepID=A0A8X8XBJ7_SALSN|nr:hypothetical protein SASPL_127816 [Salvia splendens]